MSRISPLEEIIIILSLGRKLSCEIIILCKVNVDIEHCLMMIISQQEEFNQTMYLSFLIRSWLPPVSTLFTQPWDLFHDTLTWYETVNHSLKISIEVGFISSFENNLIIVQPF